MSRQTQPLQGCDDNNASTASYLHKRPPELLSVDEKSHSACPTISNISEILSLSNSSISSVFPSADGISKNVYELGQSELPSSSSGKMHKSDLTFAGKFKQTTSSSSTGCGLLYYNNINTPSGNSPNQKFTVFGGSGTTNSNDSTSNSRTSQFDSAIKHEGNSSTDNVVSVVAASTTTAPYQQSIDLTTIDLSSEQTIKQQKKRGRKKGSKGVDSIIAKEASLSSQILISTLTAAGKKVKTTKELYAEMENRKLRNVKAAIIGGDTPSSSSTTWTSHQLKAINSPRTSNCSDIAESDSCTMTSEPSRDSGGIPLKIVGKREMPLDSNSNYSQHGSEIKLNDICGEGTTPTTTTPNFSTLLITLKLKHELQEILKHLPPPPRVEEIECDCFNNVTPCTCVVEEIVVSDDPYIHEGCGDQIGDSSLSASNNFIKYDKKELETEQMINNNDAKFLFERQSDTVDQPLPPTKPKKSIFDLDFDDEEDPLNSIIADIVGKSAKESVTGLTRKSETASPTGENQFITPHKDETISGINNHEKCAADIHVPSPISANVVVIPFYKVKYDPECEAKNRFEVQTQKITKFHVNTLHNCFIPNVNGNWNHVDVRSNRSSVTKKCETNDNGNDLKPNIADGYDVVPIYGSEMNEKIAKDLNHVNFTTKFKHKSWNSRNEILFHIPFMGVSRLPEISRVKSNKTEFLNEEEKENFDNILKVNNLRSHVSESAVKNCSENESDDAKDIKEIPIKRKKKRFKKSAPLTKCSKIKRLKLSVNGGQSSQNQCDFGSHRGVFKLKDNNGISSSDSDADVDEHSFQSDNYLEGLGNNEFDKVEVSIYHHEVVSHDMSDNSNGQNHIVLTIKKTPSKSNSPLNTLPNLIPTYSDIDENLNRVANKENSKTSSRGKQNQEVDVSSLKKYKDFLRLKRIKSHKLSESYENFKLHNSLFYHEEICPLIMHGTQLYRESIFHISSCSSSCSADEETNAKTPPLKLRRRIRLTSSSSSSNSSLERNPDHKYDGLTLNLQQDFIYSEFKKRTINNTPTNNVKSSQKSLDIKLDFQPIETDNDILLDNDDGDLPAENNLMLVSFNHMYSTRDGNITYLNNEQLNKHSNERENNLLKQQHQNCDDSNLNNNFNLIKYIDNKSSVSSNINNNNNNSSIINYLDSNITLSGKCKNSENHDDNNDGNKNVTFQEYQSGIPRAVDEDDANYEQENNCTRLQEFKEWHEVLQLRSYNDELLTVLPYVVLD